jgi:hypothetical protein
VEDNASRKDIAYWLHPYTFLQRRNLWSHVAWSTATIEDIVVGIDPCGETEIDDDGIERLVVPQHNVFGLDVPVHYPVGVNFHHSLGHTDHELSDLILTKFALTFVDASM